MANNKKKVKEKSLKQSRSISMTDEAFDKICEMARRNGRSFSQQLLYYANRGASLDNVYIEM